MSYEPVPTGRMRLRAQPRKGFFGSREPLLVLQAEVDVPDGPPDSNGLPQWLATRTWVDAQVKHLPIIPLDLA
ncbi:hypothetical protein AXL1_02 [Stenotrophomonas phage vB_SmaS-AXL_1]|uniref:hypothetical protein n=1 Tax=Stenotrophomonas phage vB_SmaS-AXL_1 TaxID=2909581 RepID=UPI00240A78CE|nr:hypothetical protein P9A52_gp02 [Stenotrophomonas phage vB_SmaS-AXL_1]UIS24797.1 hypothetical protein AXL1_02 [Stenotrophomonas phage vB_SmaS-AXL_1]